MNKRKIWEEAKGYLGMIVGCVFYALSIVLFLEPCGIVAGGVAGLSTLLHLINENIPIGMITIAINIPIFLLGLKYTGWKFILRCLLTVAVLGLATDLLAFLPAMTADPLLASLYGGIFQGVGIGLFIRFEFSSGGTELLGRVISKWVKVINIPVCVGLCDALIVVAGAIVLQSADNILYALIVVFVSTKLSELILVGLEKSKLCIIISNKGKEIAQTLIEKSPRGVTMLDGEGMYTHEDRDVLLTCVKNRQLTQLRQIVHEIDENAFVIINDSVEVRGKGFTSWNKEL
ncbi:MAG: YitT family protein [Clostridia bacterium]|nr:YitT family protein [Clostridia bacterium]